MTSWSERALNDKGLAAWRDAEIARAVVELAALKVEYAHRGQVIADLQDKLAEQAAQIRQLEGKRKK